MQACSVKGCGLAAAVGAQIRAPLDDGTEHALQLPLFFCAQHRENVDVNETMTDALWDTISKMLPQGRTTEREKVTVKLVDLRKLSIPPEIVHALNRFSSAFMLCDRQNTTQTRAQAITTLAERAYAAARVLRNYPGSGKQERFALADVMVEVEEAALACAQHLFRAQTESEELTKTLREAGGRCSALINPMLLAVDLAVS